MLDKKRIGHHAQASHSEIISIDFTVINVVVLDETNVSYIFMNL